MTLSPRALGVVLCLAASGCFGGPTSDWPGRASGDGTKTDDESPHTPPKDLGAGADAGVRDIDAGSAATGGSAPCVTTPADDGGTDAGVGDPVRPLESDSDEPAQPDASCR